MTKLTVLRTIAGLLMYVPFMIMSMIELWLVVPVCMLLYAFGGNQWAQERVFRSGKSLDQLCNTAWFWKGHWKETISSHIGRIMVKYGDRAPWQAKTVAYLCGLVEKDHVYKAIEEPFKDYPTGLEDRLDLANVTPAAAV